MITREHLNTQTEVQAQLADKFARAGMDPATAWRGAADMVTAYLLDGKVDAIQLILTLTDAGTVQQLQDIRHAVLNA